MKSTNRKLLTLRNLILFAFSVFILTSILTGLFVKSTISQYKRLTNHVSFQELPKDLTYSTVVAYDKKYYHHDRFGAEPFTMVRKGTYILFHNPNDFGLAFLLSNKLLEKGEYKAPYPVQLARTFIGFIYLEDKFTRDQVLYLFLQEGIYAKDIKGIDQAANSYYGKKLNELNLSESIVLVATMDKLLGYESRSEKILEELTNEKYIRPNEKYPNQDISDLRYTIWRFEMEFLNPPSTKPITKEEMNKAHEVVDSIPQVKYYLAQGNTHTSIMCYYESAKGDCYTLDDDYIAVKLGREGAVFSTIEWYYVDRKTFAVYKDFPGYGDLIKIK